MNDVYGLDVTDKVKSFLADIRSVCIKHNLQISTSGYDGVQIWRLKAGDEFIHCAGIDDMTQGDA